MDGPRQRDGQRRLAFGLTVLAVAALLVPVAAVGGDADAAGPGPGHADGTSSHAPSDDLEVHDPIRIEGDADLAAQAAAEGWPGAGTPADPYVIAGLDITADGAPALFVSGTSAHLVIRDNFLHSGRDQFNGLRLFGTANVTVQSNHMLRNRHGLLAEQCAGPLTVVGNLAERNAGAGLEVQFCDGTLFADNDVSVNAPEPGEQGLGFGIVAVVSDDVRTLSNRVVNNTGIGIAYHGSGAGLVRDNLVEGNGDGMQLDLGVGTVVAGNVVRHNQGDGIRIANLGRGIHVVDNVLEGHPPPDLQAGDLFAAVRVLEDDNRVAKNRIARNGVGVLVEGAERTVVFDNRFQANTVDALALDTQTTRWNVSKTALPPGTPNAAGGPFLGGNLWDTYVGADLDADGLGDVAHRPVPWDLVSLLLGADVQGPDDQLPLVRGTVQVGPVGVPP